MIDILHSLLQLLLSPAKHLPNIFSALAVHLSNGKLENIEQAFLEPADIWIASPWK